MSARPICELMRSIPSSVHPAESAARLLRRMRSEGAAIVPVLDHGELIGLVVERDLVEIGSETLARCQVRDVMRGDPLSAPPWRPVSAVLSCMVEQIVDAVVIIDRGHLVGLFTLDDLAGRCGTLLDEANLLH